MSPPPSLPKSFNSSASPSHSTCLYTAQGEMSCPSGVEKFTDKGDKTQTQTPKPAASSVFANFLQSYKLPFSSY